MELEIQKSADSHYVSEAKEVEVTYDVSEWGTVNGDLEEFREVARETLGNERGWGRAGVKFKEVEADGQMHLVLAAPETVGSFSGCADTLSCTYGTYVMINDDRWMGSSDAYNAIGIFVDDYRPMVINHEVGHFLGHYHDDVCGTAAGKAPIMITSATGLGGCSPSIWPLPNELWHKF